MVSLEAACPIDDIIIGWHKKPIGTGVENYRS